MAKEPNQEMSASREQLLNVAEGLFSERGYKSVTLKDIADALGVKQAALYYHVPQGKEQLYVEVMTRSYERHRKGLESARNQAEPNIMAQLRAISNWLLSQPPIDVSRMARSDLPALSEKNRQLLYKLGDTALAEPILEVLNQAYERGEIRVVDARIMATVFLSMIDTIHDIHIYKALPKEAVAMDILEVFLTGMLRR
jgi:AcrR family transcriptional regulator